MNQFKEMKNTSQRSGPYSVVSVKIVFHGVEFVCEWSCDSYKLMLLSDYRSEGRYMRGYQTYEYLKEKSRNEKSVVVLSKFAKLVHNLHKRDHEFNFSFCLDELKFRLRLEHLFDIDRRLSDSDRIRMDPVFKDDICRLEYSDSYVDALPSHLYMFLYRHNIDRVLGPYSDMGYTTDESDTLSVHTMSSQDSHHFGFYEDSISDSEISLSEHSSSGSISDFEPVLSDYGDGDLDYHFHEHFVIQSEEIDEKEVRRQQFKLRNKSRKVDSLVKMVKDKKLTKGEVKKLAKLMSTMKVNAEETVEVEVTTNRDGFDFSPIYDIFKEDPHTLRVLHEVVRLTTGLYCSTTRGQMIHHIFFSATSLGLEYFPEFKPIIHGLFATEQAGNFGDLVHETIKYWKDNKILDDLKKGVVIMVSLALQAIPDIKPYIPDLGSLLGDVKLLKLSAFDLLSYAMSAYLYVAERVKLVYETGCLKSFFTPLPKLRDIAARYDVVVHMMPHLMAGNTEMMQGKSVDDWAKEIHKLLQDLILLTKTCGPEALATVNRWRHTIFGLVVQLESRLSERSVRPCPISINLAGTSGVGKTVLIPLIAKCIASAYDITLEEADFFFRSPSDDYWSGYYGQRVLVEDEKNAMIASNTTVNENKVTLDVVNNSIMRLNMADLPSKGIFTMRSLIHIMTTNKLDAQASLNCNEPAAVLRRSIHIVVEVKPEFRKIGSDMLDPDKCNCDPLTDNAWLFTIMEAETSPTQNLGAASGWYWKVLCDETGRYYNKVELHDLFMFLRQRTVKHIAKQNAILNNFSSLFSTKLCEHGSGATICRLCNPDLQRFPYTPTLCQMSGNVANRNDVVTYKEQGGLFTIGLTSMVCVYIGAYIQTWFNKHWWLRVLMAYLRTKCFEVIFSVMGKCCSIGHKPWNTISAQVFMNFKTALTSRWISNSFSATAFQANPWGFGILASCYYAIVPFCFKFLIGGHFLTAILIGEACSAWCNRMAYQYYKQMDRRGATNSLSDWAALKARPFFTSKWNYVAIATTIGSALALYSMLNPRKLTGLQEQGAINSSNWNPPYKPPPVVEKERITTVWGDLVKSVEKRIVHFSFYTENDKHMDVNGIPVKSGVWIIPGHALRHTSSLEWRGYGKVDIVFNGAIKGADVKGVPIDISMVHFIPDKDMALIYIAQTAGTMRDMTPFLTDEHRDCVATYIYKNKEGKILSMADNSTRLHYAQIVGAHCKWGYECLAPYPTFMGLCGAAQVSHTKTPAIVSYHIYGRDEDRTSVCIPIVKSEIMEGVKIIFSNPMTLETGSFERMDFSDGSDKVILKDHHPKSPFIHLEKGNFIHHGSVAERGKAKPTIINTIMAETVESTFGVKNIWGNPQLLRSWKPWYACAEMLTQPHFKSPTDLRSAFMDYRNTIVSAILRRGDLNKFKPLDELTILSGLDNHDFYKRIDDKTSSGYPFKRKKKTFLSKEYHPDDLDHQYHTVMNDWAKNRVIECEERCKLGLRPNCIYSASFKIEPKALFEEKDGVLVPKVAMPRIFYPACFELIYLMRKYFMPILQLVQSCVESEMSMNINAMGPDWGKLAATLLAMSNFLMPADQEKFDRSVTPEELVPIYRMFIDIAALCGYSKEDLAIMRILVTCVIYPIIEFDTDLVSFYTLHGSGGFATAQLNSIVNSVRHRMLYYSKMFRDSLDRETRLLITNARFNKFVRLATYGDDSLPAVSSHIVRYYNLVTFATYMKTQGVNVTNAQKSGSLVEHLPLVDCDYLKRSFRFDKEREVITAPLVESSIIKRLCVLDPSKELTHEEQCGEALSSSLRDYFEYGRDVFNDRRAKLITVAEKCGLINYVGCGFPQYETFVQEYKSKYKSNPIPQPCGM